MNKKKLLVMILGVGVLLMTVGIGLFWVSKDNSLTNKENISNAMEKAETKNIGEESSEKNYKKIGNPLGEELIQINKEKFIKLVNEIGFKEKGADCSEFLCSYYNQSYSATGYTDSVGLSWEDNEVIALDIVVYYSKKDFNIEKMYEDTKTLVGNFINMNIEKEKITAMKVPTTLKEIGSSDFTYGDYTVQITLLNIPDDGAYCYKIFIVRTDKYM